MGFRLCNSNPDDLWTEPKGWFLSPCEVPKCRRFVKCEKDMVMCRAFHEWATGGKYVAVRGHSFVTIIEKDTKRNGKRNTFNNEPFLRDVERMVNDGYRYKEIANKHGITTKYISVIVGRLRKDKNYKITKGVKP